MQKLKLLENMSMKKDKIPSRDGCDENSKRKSFKVNNKELHEK